MLAGCLTPLSPLKVWTTLGGIFYCKASICAKNHFGGLIKNAQPLGFCSFHVSIYMPTCSMPFTVKSIRELVWELDLQSILCSPGWPSKLNCDQIKVDWFDHNWSLVIILLCNALSSRKVTISVICSNNVFLLFPRINVITHCPTYRVAGGSAFGRHSSALRHSARRLHACVVSRPLIGPLHTQSSDIINANMPQAL